MADSSDLDFDEDEYDPLATMDPETAGQDETAEGSHGPTGPEEEVVEDIGEDPDDSVSELDHDELRAQIIDEIESETDLELPRQQAADIEPRSQFDERIDTNLSDSDDPEIAEAELAERFQAAKDSERLAEFTEFMKEAVARQRAALEAAARPAPPSDVLEAVPPSVFDERVMGDDAFDQVLAARDQGLDYLPTPSGVEDLGAAYASFISRTEDD